MHRNQNKASLSLHVREELLHLNQQIMNSLINWDIITYYSKPGDSSVQILLLAVRRRWRECGIGEYLLRLCKDPSIVGQYDLILTYADHKAEGFFSRFGFTVDPIITARHKYVLFFVSLLTELTIQHVLLLIIIGVYQIIGRTVH